MKSIYKSITGLVVAGCLMLVLTNTASAQRGFRGGVHVGVGFGGPRFGFGFGYAGPRYYYNPYWAYPSLGFYINALPYGYYPFYYGPDQYFYADGTFYRPNNNGYEVAAPPIGATVPKIPSNAKSIMIDGQQYYELGGVYYKPGVDDRGKKVYTVAGKDGVLNTGDTDQAAPRAPQVGDIVNQLPDGCRKVTLNGKKYYVSADDIYYEEFTDANNTTSYRIASIPEPQAPVQQ